MKEWKKPEIVDLDVKLTENVPFTTSGGYKVLEPEEPKPTCDECEKEKIHIANLHTENNHKGWCSHLKQRENKTCGR